MNLLEDILLVYGIKFQVIALQRKINKLQLNL
jgi:hypothetical protein